MTMSSGMLTSERADVHAAGRPLTRERIVGWLRETDPRELSRLWALADRVRSREVGSAVHLRGLIEFSNRCDRRCLYCGLRAPRRIERYSLSSVEILECAQRARQAGCGTVVLQSGEDASLDVEWMADLVRRIKMETDLAVTLSLGELNEGALWRLKRAGADRYFLRFETSNRELFQSIHPPRRGADAVNRIARLGLLRDLGYEIGSGIMIGLPGQTFDDVARDLLWFERLDLDMVGVGPFLPHVDTPLGKHANRLAAPAGAQISATAEMTCKVVALTRLIRPRANIPSTTALATLAPDAGAELGLRRGANVVMPNFTPWRVRNGYEIYPGKTSAGMSLQDGDEDFAKIMDAWGRTVGRGRGDSPNFRQRTKTA